MKNKIITFDLGGSSIKYSIDMLKTFKTIEIKNIDKQAVLKFISKIANLEKATEICISSPALIDTKNGYISGLSAIKDWTNFNIFDELSKYLNNKKTKIYIENDANCSLLGNIKKIKTKVNSAISIVIGTGIGGSFYLDGKIFKGKTNSTGEFGMIKFIDNPTKTISSELSTNALCKKVENELKIKLNGIEIFNEYSRNKKINNIVNNWIYNNSLFIYNILWSFDPEYIFIGGAISKNKIFRKLIKNNLLTLFKEINCKLKAKILFSDNGNKTNLLGSLLQSKNYKI